MLQIRHITNDPTAVSVIQKITDTDLSLRGATGLHRQCILEA